jgi:hypothetical protein
MADTELRRRRGSGPAEGAQGDDSAPGGGDSATPQQQQQGEQTRLLDDTNAEPQIAGAEAISEGSFILSPISWFGSFISKFFGWRRWPWYVTCIVMVRVMTSHTKYTIAK